MVWLLFLGSAFSLVLCKNGVLFEVCPYTLAYTVIKLPNDDHIQDIIVIDNDQTKIELMLLVKSQATQKMLMRIVEFPSKYH